MDTAPEKNKKKFIFGSIILFLALLIAFGPVMVAKYVRNKDAKLAQELKKTYMKMKVKGTLKISTDGKLYLHGENQKIYLIIGDLTGELKAKVNQTATIFGPMVQALGAKIDGNGVRMIISVEKYGLPDIDFALNPKMSDEEIAKMKEKLSKRKAFVDEANLKLKKRVRYAAVKGSISVENRKTLDGQDKQEFILTDEFGDKFVLYDKNMRLQKFEGNNVICLGRETLPQANMPLVIDEVTFEIYEMYDFDYKRLI